MDSIMMTSDQLAIAQCVALGDFLFNGSQGSDHPSAQVGVTVSFTFCSYVWLGRNGAIS